MSAGVPRALLGASPFAVAVAAGLRLSHAQAATLKAMAGEPLSRDELRTFRSLTGTTFAKPRAGGYRELFVNAGRRGGKTSHVAAPIVCSALLSDPARLNAILAPGERARVLLVAPTIPHVSQLQDTIAGLLERLGVRFARKEREIDLAPSGLRTVAVATVADHVAVRSGTAIAAVVDEAALLPFDEQADGYDAEVFASIRPSLATTNGPLVAISTPWAQRGVHFETCTSKRGKTSGEVLVVDGPTWTWNNTLTEEQTRAFESDPRRWSREYQARAGEHESALLDSRDVREAVDRGVDERPAREGVMYVMAIDVAFRSDRFAIVVAHREQLKREGQPPLDAVVVDLVRVATPVPGQRLDFDELMQRCANIARRFNGARIVRDSFSGDAVDHALRTRGIRSEERPMGAQAQARRWTLLQQKFRGGAVRLVENDVAIRELIDLRVKLHGAGRIEVAAPNRKGAHDDAADAIALAVEAAMELPATGGDIQCDVQVKFSVDEGLSVERQWFETVPAPGGGFMRVPCAPPTGTVDWLEARNARRAKGGWQQGDDDDEPGGGLSIGVRGS